MFLVLIEIRLKRLVLLCIFGGVCLSILRTACLDVLHFSWLCLQTVLSQCCFNSLSRWAGFHCSICHFSVCSSWKHYDNFYFNKSFLASNNSQYLVRLSNYYLNAVLLTQLLRYTGHISSVSCNNFQRFFKYFIKNCIQSYCREGKNMNFRVTDLMRAAGMRSAWRFVSSFASALALLFNS